MQKLSNFDRKYENFRWFFTSNNVLVVGGKSDEQNEIAMTHFLKLSYVILHTTEPGSPFMIIQSENPSKEDIEEGAVFCACFSKQWKLNKKTIDVDVFRGDQIYKTKSMKTGTFGVKGSKRTIKANAELILVVQNGRLRAVPKLKKNSKKSSSSIVLAEIKQGNLSKEQAADKIAKKVKSKYNLPISREEIMSAIPSSNLNVK